MDEENKEMSNDPSSLPSELVIEILTRVPAKPVLRFKCVSKEWLNIITNPNFIRRHISQSIRANSGGTLIVHQGNTLYTLDFQNPNYRATKLDYPENIDLPQPRMLNLVGSCNGLLCIQFGNQIALYNPITQAHKILPKYSLGDGVIGSYEKPQTVFAYDNISNDYKVLRFVKERDNHHLLQLGPELLGNTQGRIVLYSLSTNSWEIIKNPPWDQESVMFPGVVANNTVYWMDSDHKDIKAFDLFSRRYYMISFPEKISPGYSPKLAVLEGRLYIVTYYFDIWKLEGFGEHESCWTKIFRCPNNQWHDIYSSSSLQNWRKTSSSLACSEDRCRILVAHVCGPLNFICCDLKTQKATMIEVPGLTSNKFYAVLPWTDSFVSVSN